MLESCFNKLVQMHYVGDGGISHPVVSKWELSRDEKVLRVSIIDKEDGNDQDLVPALSLNLESPQRQLLEILNQKDSNAIKEFKCYRDVILFDDDRVESVI